MQMCDRSDRMQCYRGINLPGVREIIIQDLFIEKLTFGRSNCYLCLENENIGIFCSSKNNFINFCVKYIRFREKLFFNSHCLLIESLIL